MSRAHRKRASVALICALAVLGAGCYSVYAAVVRGTGKHAVPSRRWSGKRAPTPVIGERPSDPTDKRHARFTFSDSDPSVTFRCSLDGGKWTPCVSPARYRRLGIGEHWFRVRARHRPGRRSNPVGLYWRVMKSEAGEDFSISAATNPGEPLYPGAPPTVIPVTLSNPNDVAIFVTNVSVTIAASPPGCDSASNISLAQSNVTGSIPVVVPAHGSLTLPAQGRSAPTIQLLDLPVNQDACQHTTFPLSFTGSAHS
jgi:hypothetical protein